MAKPKLAPKKKPAKPTTATKVGRPSVTCVIPQIRTYSLPDHRLERPKFRIYQSGEGSNVEYKVEGDLSAPTPPIRESKYLSREQCLALCRWMLLNCRMEAVLENLYKQGKVVGGVYFGLGQEGCSCASALALQPEDWLGPMIRNQGAVLVRGFSPRDIMRQYMAKADSPTFGRDASSHFGDWEHRHVCAPISMRGRPAACLYVTHRQIAGLFGEDEKRLADFIATLTGAALENAEGFDELKRLNSTLELRVEQYKRAKKKIEEQAALLDQAAVVQDQHALARFQDHFQIVRGDDLADRQFL